MINRDGGVSSTINGRADVDRLLDNVLSHHGLDLKPRVLPAASGDVYTAFLLEIGNLIRYLYENPTLAAAFHFSAQRTPNAHASDATRTYTSVEDSDWYIHAQQRAPTG